MKRALTITILLVLFLNLKVFASSNLHTCRNPLTDLNVRKIESELDKDIDNYKLVIKALNILKVPDSYEITSNDRVLITGINNSVHKYLNLQPDANSLFYQRLESTLKVVSPTYFKTSNIVELSSIIKNYNSNYNDILECELIDLVETYSTSLSMNQSTEEITIYGFGCNKEAFFKDENFIYKLNNKFLSKTDIEIAKSAFKNELIKDGGYIAIQESVDIDSDELTNIITEVIFDKGKFRHKDYEVTYRVSDIVFNNLETFESSYMAIPINLEELYRGLDYNNEISIFNMNEVTTNDSAKDDLDYINIRSNASDIHADNSLILKENRKIIKKKGTLKFNIIFSIFIIILIIYTVKNKEKLNLNFKKDNDNDCPW